MCFVPPQVRNYQYSNFDSLFISNSKHLQQNKNIFPFWEHTCNDYSLDYPIYFQPKNLWYHFKHVFSWHQYAYAPNKKTWKTCNRNNSPENLIIYDRVHLIMIYRRVRYLKRNRIQNRRGCPLLLQSPLLLHTRQSHALAWYTRSFWWGHCAIILYYLPHHQPVCSSQKWRRHVCFHFPFKLPQKYD